MGFYPVSDQSVAPDRREPKPWRDAISDFFQQIVNVNLLTAVTKNRYSHCIKTMWGKGYRHGPEY